MELSELKNIIDTKSEIKFPLILKYEGNTFLCDQYVEEICKNYNLKRNSIESLNELPSKDLLFDAPLTDIYVYKVDKLKELIFEDMDQLIVICKDVPKKLGIDFIEVPIPLAWQIEDYVRMRAPGLKDKEVKWLCDVTKYDIYRLNIETEKLNVFSEKSQSIILKKMIKDQVFADLDNKHIYDFTSALLQKDLITIHDVLKNLDHIDIEATGIMTLLYVDLKVRIDLKLLKNVTAEAEGISPGRLKAIDGNPSKLRLDQMISIFDFILDLDKRLKSGELCFSNDSDDNNHKMVEYITYNFIDRAFS